MFEPEAEYQYDARRNRLWVRYSDAIATVDNATPTRTGGRVGYVTLWERGEGEAILNAGRLDLTDVRQRVTFAAQGAKRNSGDTAIWENRLLEIDLILSQEMGGVAVSGPPAFESMSDFLNSVDPNRQDLVEGLLELGNVYLLAGRYKASKSILAINLALATARGGFWLGRKVQQGPVYWLQLEDSDRLIARRWKNLAGAVTHNINIARGPWQLNETNLNATIGALLDASLILVDPLISAVNVQHWSDMTEVRQAYDLWRIIARETNAVVLLIAHHRKLSGDDGDQVAGSHQAGASVDGIIEIRKGGQGIQDNERRLSYTGRDWPDLPDEVIALHSDSLVFNLRGDYKTRQQEARANEAISDIQPLYRALKSGPVMQKALKDEVLKWRGDRFYAALEAAKESGVVIQYKNTNPDTGRKVNFVALADGAPDRGLEQH